jgi:hypothetical protein
MINSRPPLLYQHVAAKNPEGTDLKACFLELSGWDPNDPDGSKAAAADKAAAAKKAKPKAKKNTDDFDLLDAGLSKGGKKK